MVPVDRLWKLARTFRKLRPNAPPISSGRIPLWKTAPECLPEQSVHRAAYPAPMPLVQPCSEPGCSTLTMGDLCLEHDLLAQERLAKRMVALSRRFRAPAVALAVAAVAALVGRASR
jgi:hypothetical protein